MPRLIEIIVSPTGESTLRTEGYSGGDCLQASRFLEEALGVTGEEHKTAEFYQTDASIQHARL